MEKQPGRKLSRTVLVIGYGWEHPRKGEKEKAFRKLRRGKRKETPIYPTLPPSQMSRAVDSVAVDLVRGDNQAEEILITGRKMGHIVSFPATQKSFFDKIAPEVKVTSIGKAWTTSREIRKYFRYLRTHGETEGTIVYLDPHEPRIKTIVDSLSTQRRNKGIEIALYNAEVHEASLPKTVAQPADIIQFREDFSDLSNSERYQAFLAYEEGGIRKKQKLVERAHAAFIIDYIYRFKKTNRDPLITGVV